jgi:hypothetical protein
MALQGDPVQTYRERLPAPEIAREVASVWLLEVGAGGGAYEHRTVPNGSVEISYALGSERVVVSGPQSEPLAARVESGTTLIGIRFRPGAAPSILGPPASELVDLRVDLDRLWGSGVATLVERLGEAGAPHAAARLLEDELASRVADATAPDPLVAAAIGRLQPWRSGGLDALGVGPLHLPPPASPALRGRARLRPQDARAHPALPRLSRARPGTRSASRRSRTSRATRRLCRPAAPDEGGGRPRRNDAAGFPRGDPEELRPEPRPRRLVRRPAARAPGCTPHLMRPRAQS